MTTIDQRDFFKAQSLELDRLLALSGDHPIMGLQLRARREEIAAKLASGYADAVEVPAVRLYFSGAPVRGSEGIDAKFAAESIRFAQEMVSSDYAAKRHGTLAGRGVRRNEAEAKLMLTGLPRGSFGLELSKPQVDDFVQAQELQSTLDKITHLIASSAESDAAFDQAIEGVAWRVIDRLRDFLLLARNHRAALRIATRNRESSLSESEISAAASRVEAARHSEGDETIQGVFRGARLEAWQFDFLANDGRSISGRLAETLEESDVIRWNRELTGSSTEGVFFVSRVITTSGRERVSYELKNLNASAS